MSLSVFFCSFFLQFACENVVAIAVAVAYNKVTDEFIIEETTKKSNTSARGSLAKYANTALWEGEGTAWGKAAGEKYGNA